MPSLATTSDPPVLAPPPAPSTTAPPTSTGTRLDAVDLVRGLVMVVMLLDHTRDFVHSAAYQYDAADLSRTSVALFLTRWITHFCAPLFVFLAGASVYFQRRRGKPIDATRRFLVTRGLWLVLLELTVVRWVAFFDVHYAQLGAVVQVIFAIGAGMLALAALLSLPTRVIGGLGVAIVALHNLLDRVPVTTWAGPGSPVPGAAQKLFLLLHQPGAFPIAGWPSPLVFVLYPVLPWIGVLLAGYAFGAVYDLAPAARRRTLLRLGASLTVAFVVLRLLGAYGDPLGWQPHHPRGAVYAALSFVRTQKYPPSLLYLLMTLGPGILLLGALEGRLGADAARRAPARWLVTFGRVPLFYYVLQWIVAHGAGLLLSAAAGKATWIYFTSPMTIGPNGPPTDFGFPLWVVYACWLTGLLLLYPLCRWFAAVKARRRDWWISYL